MPSGSMTTPSVEHIKALLEEVTDPEIPVLTIMDMGVVRAVRLSGTDVAIDLTPTYSGCPAMQTIEAEIRACLTKNGYGNIEVKEVLHPAWTTDWLTEKGKQKLEEYGISPPEGKSQDKSLLTSEPKQVKCPRCKSRDTEMISQFGSTACKSLYKCHACLETFDYFKCI
jgi:ring-1,2-phenylacetyl-CoA epoxidase subunit PaaD